LKDDSTPKGIAFITFKTKEGVTAALKFDGQDYGGRTLVVNLAGGSAKGKGEKGKGKDKNEKGKGKTDRNDELTALVGGLPYDTEESALKEEFASCGEFERFSMPKHESGTPKGFAFIQFKTQDALDKALAKDGQDFGGRYLGVKKASDGGKGKGKDGKGKDGKGKGKGKDGKGKDKAKGKSKTPDFAGKKETVEENADDEPAKKKAKVAAPADDDSSE